MESDSNNNHALNLLKALRTRAGRGGKVQIDMSEICRAAGLGETDVRECLDDLESEGFIRTEITCYVKKEWR
jgi:DNA-binding IclR family transcriptional regulator